LISLKKAAGSVLRAASIQNLYLAQLSLLSLTIRCKALAMPRSPDLLSAFSAVNAPQNPRSSAQIRGERGFPDDGRCRAMTRDLGDL